MASELESTAHWWEWWYCKGGGGDDGSSGGGGCIGWMKRTRIANWSDTPIEIRLQDSRTGIIVRDYRLSPGARKKLRCARARKLCGGDDSNILVMVCRPGSEELLTETITGNDLHAYAEIKIRQHLPPLEHSFFLLKIPRLSSSPSSNGSRRPSHRTSSLSSSCHNPARPLAIAAPTVISSSRNGSFTGSSRHHPPPPSPQLLHPHSVHHHPLRHIGHSPRSQSSSSLANSSDGMQPLAHSSFPPIYHDCINVPVLYTFQQGTAAAPPLLPSCATCNARTMAHSTSSPSSTECNTLAMAQIIAVTNFSTTPSVNGNGEPAAEASAHSSP